MTTTTPKLQTLHPNPDWAKLPLFDRKGRKTVQFCDVVENVTETERAPAEAGMAQTAVVPHGFCFSLELRHETHHIRIASNKTSASSHMQQRAPGE